MANVAANDDYQCTRSPQWGIFYSVDYPLTRLAVFLLFFPLLAELFWVADPEGSCSDVRMIFSLTQ